VSIEPHPSAVWGAAGSDELIVVSPRLS